MITRRIAIAAGVVLMVALAAFAIIEAGIPIGGVSRPEATRLAVVQAQAQSAGMPSVKWAIPGMFGVFRGGATDAIAPWYRTVWAVRISGTFHTTCGPFRTGVEPLRCPDAHTETVILDYVSGQFIMATIEP